MKGFVELVNKYKIPIKYSSMPKLDKLTAGKNHRGVVLKCEKKSYIDIKNFSDFQETAINKKTGNVVCLTQGMKANHCTAVFIRTCFYMGVDSIIFDRRDRPEMNTQMARVSGGASEIFPFYSIRFIKNFLQKAREEGWKVIGITSDNSWLEDEEPESNTSSSSSSSESEEDKEENQNMKKVALDEINIDPNDNIILLISKNPESHSHSIDYLVKINALGDESKMDVFPYNYIKTLNTPVTTGMVLSSLKKNRS